jgi:hypothetical protein
MHGVTAQAKTFIFCVKQWFNDCSTTVPKEARRYSTYDNVGQYKVDQKYR